MGLTMRGSPAILIMGKALDQGSPCNRSQAFPKFVDLDRRKGLQSASRTHATRPLTSLESN
jgi:hypothetical protein